MAPPPIDPPPPPRERLVLRGLHVVNAWSPKLAVYGITRADVPNYRALGETHDISIAEGIIESVRPSGGPSGDDAATSRQQEHRGLFAFPGLIDSHSHSLPGPTSRLYNLLHLLHGVTSVRELAGGPAFLCQAEARAIDRGDLAGPRYFYVGRALDGDPVALVASESIADASAAARAVKARAEAGAFGAKVFNNLSQSCVDAAAAEAERQGVVLVGHCPRATPLETCGLADVQHLTGLPPAPSAAWGDDQGAFCGWLAAWGRCDAARLEQVAATALRLGQAHTPTLGLYWHALHEAEAFGGPQRPADLGDGSACVPCETPALPVPVGPCRCANAPGAEAEPKLRLVVPDSAKIPDAGSPQAAAAVAAAAAGSLSPHCCAVTFARRFLPRFLSEAVWHPDRLLEPYWRCMCAQVREGLPGAFPDMLGAVAALHSAGVVLHAGTDCLTPWSCPGRSLYEELLLLRAAGLSDEEALAADTSLPGAFLATLPRYRKSPERTPASNRTLGPRAIIPPAESTLGWLGVLREGAPADVLISTADPRLGLGAALDGLVAVVAAGRYYTVAELRERVRAYGPWCRSSWSNALVPVLGPVVRSLVTPRNGPPPLPKTDDYSRQRKQ